MRALDKRENGRVPVALDVTHERGGCTTSTHTRNLSYGGMQLWMGESVVQRGERLILALWLPAAEERILCEGEVVYRRGRVAGLRFTRVPLPHRLVLEDYVSNHLMERWFR